MLPREAGNRRSRRKVRCSLLGLLVLSSCSPFTAAEAEGDGGVGDASSQADGSTPASLDGGLDATVDGSFSGCAAPGAHTLCEDFDRPNPFSAWQQVQPSNVTLLNLDSQLAVSAPNSLRVDVGASAESHTGFLHRTVPGEKRIALEADVFASLGAGTDNEIDVLALELDPPEGTTRYFVGLIVRSDKKFVLETNVSGTADRKEITGLKPSWAHATLDLDLANGRVVGTIDNSRTDLDLPSVAGRGGTLKIGASWANNTAGRFQVNIDNVVLDADR